MTIIRFQTQTEADLHWMACAFEARAGSDDPKAKIIAQSGVGAVIANRDNVIAQSANIIPPVVLATMRANGREVTDDDRYFIIEHAERAAIFDAFQSGASLSNATIYCTRFPCADCARAIVWSGIKRAVFAGGFSGETRWIGAQRAARQLLKDAGIKVRFLTPNSANI